MTTHPPAPSAAPPPPAGYAVVGRWLLFAQVLLAPLLFCPWTVEGFGDAKAALLTLTATALAALGLWAWLGRPMSRPRFDLVTAGFFLFALSAAASTLFSLSPRMSWRGAPDSHGGLRTILGYLVLFLATRLLCRTDARGRRLLVAAVVAAAAASGYALLQAARLDPLPWDGAAVFARQPRPFATFGHANLLGAYLAVALPLAAAVGLHAARRRRWLRLGVLVCVSAVAVPALVLTLSRAAWLAAGCALLLLLAGWWRTRARAASAGCAVALLLCGMVGALAYERGWLPDSLREALGERLRHASDGAGRKELWKAGWEIFCDRPVTGCGLDTFRLAFGAKRTPAFLDAEGDATPVNAHNAAVHILATQGALGAGAALVFLAGLGRAALGAWRRGGDKPLLVALVASVVGYLVANLFGFTLIGCDTLFVVCAALLSRRGEKDALTSQQRGLREASDSFGLPAAALAVARVGVAALALVIVFTEVVQPLRASVAAHRGDVFLTAAPRAALACFEEAVGLDAGCDGYWTRLAHAAQLCAREGDSPDDWRRARQALERAVALVPADPYHHANLARLLGELANRDRHLADDALAEWQRALDLDSNNLCLLTEAARTALALGDPRTARRHVAHGLECYPKRAVFHAQMGLAALAEARFREAATWLGQSLDADWHGDAEALSRALAALAVVELNLKDYGRSQELAGRASVWQPGWATPHVLRAQALQALGRRVEADEEYLAAHTLDSHVPWGGAGP